MKNTSWLFLIPLLLFSLLYSPRAQAQQRKGWSPQAKDAAIGGAAGILGGALINKRNRAVGGLIGGAVGAGAGYAIGKHTDNKRKQAAALANERAAANERLAAANARANAAEHAAAERHAVARTPGSLGRVAGASTAVAAATVLAASPAGITPASGYFPNPDYGNALTAYPASAVRRKSW
ncbi:glycine zipper domain-containing protein [Hymenobacter caeli]|uniref:Glycine zipper domain-containing protein n=1 Tax=Hymenobacter caeli TaxID=2735894 RepID=A0ABX2FRQ8_9BACT|nr:glycine zipper domain-containing protein [Hymenobacter caeli]NRT19872.1 hypothetical protein [Hymenobacter caeli]